MRVALHHVPTCDAQVHRRIEMGVKNERPPMHLQAILSGKRQGRENTPTQAPQWDSHVRHDTGNDAVRQYFVPTLQSSGLGNPAHPG
jgi:hypothetical protein